MRDTIIISLPIVDFLIDLLCRTRPCGTGSTVADLRDRPKRPKSLEEALIIATPAAGQDKTLHQLTRSDCRRSPCLCRGGLVHIHDSVTWSDALAELYIGFGHLLNPVRTEMSILYKPYTPSKGGLCVRVWLKATTQGKPARPHRLENLERFGCPHGTILSLLSLGDFLSVRRT